MDVVCCAEENLFCVVVVIASVCFVCSACLFAWARFGRIARRWWWDCSDEGGGKLFRFCRPSRLCPTQMHR